MASITDNWIRRERGPIVEPGSEPISKLVLLQDPTDKDAVGVAWYQGDTAFDEEWSMKACEKLVAAGEMKFYDPTELTPAEELVDMFETWGEGC